MSSKNVQESQQQSQGIAIGTQGNEDITIPQGTKGPNRKHEGPDDRQVPNQERSSATNQGKAEDRTGQNNP